MPYQLPPPYREVHQARRRPPTEFEDSLAEALEVAFADKAWELDELVDRLNSMGSRDPQGRTWTEATFKDQISTLADDATVPEVRE